MIDFLLKGFKKSSTKEIIEKPSNIKSYKVLYWIMNRKKNIILSILMVITIKILLHYFLYPKRYRMLSLIPEHLQGSRKDLGVHINEVFNQELQLFIPTLILVLFFAWFFNDKIKAR